MVQQDIESNSHSLKALGSKHFSVQLYKYHFFFHYHSLVLKKMAIMPKIMLFFNIASFCTTTSEHDEQNLFRSVFHISTYLNFVNAARLKLQKNCCCNRGMQSFPNSAGILPRPQIYLFSSVWFDEIQFAFRSSMLRSSTEDRVLQAVVAVSKIGEKHTAFWFEN